MILDIVVIAFVLIGAFLGYKKGLVGIAISLISIILSIVLGLMLNSVIANGLYNDTPIGSTIEQMVYDGLNPKAVENSEQEADSNKEDNIYETIVNNIVGTARDTLTNEQVAKTVTMYILKGLSFVLIVVVVFIICYILRMVLNIVFNLPLLHSVNKMGGVAAGVVKALLKVYIILAIISFLAPMSLLEPVVNYINDSTIVNLLYNNNIFVYFIKSGIKI